MTPQARGLALCLHCRRLYPNEGGMTLGQHSWSFDWYAESNWELKKSEGSRIGGRFGSVPRPVYWLLNASDGQESQTTRAETFQMPL